MTDTLGRSTTAKETGKASLKGQRRASKRSRASLLYTGNQVIGRTVSNGLFRMEAGSEFLRKTIEAFVEGYDPYSWSSGGGDAMTRALGELCGCQGHPGDTGGLTLERFSRDRCGGHVELVPPKLFFPVSFYESGRLWTPPKTVAEWEEDFGESLSVDFYSSSSQSVQKALKPRFYGSSVPAYTMLGPKHCPLSFESQRMF